MKLELGVVLATLLVVALLLTLLLHKAGWPKQSLLHYLYYWMGWYGHDGKPSNKRIVWTITVFSMIGGFLALSAKSIAASQPFSEALALFGLGVLAGAGGHYLISERQQLKDPLRGTPSTPTQDAPSPSPAGDTS